MSWVNALSTETIRSRNSLPKSLPLVRFLPFYQLTRRTMENDRQNLEDFRGTQSCQVLGSSLCLS